MARLVPGRLLPDPWNSVKRSTSSPVGRTTIWWPIVDWSFCGAKIARAGSQLAPPFVVRENIASPRNEKACWALKLARSLGNRSRSQTAYTKLESFGSAVIDSLSLKRNGASPLGSRTTVMGSLHVSPPSVDLLTRIAVAGSLTKFTERLIWWTSPLGLNVTQGSEDRS